MTIAAEGRNLVISTGTASGRSLVFQHALMVLDGTGWHRSKDLDVPANASLLRLPPCSLELNPTESLFSVLRHRRFANRVFESAEHVGKTVTEVCGAFSHNSEGITQITRRKWARI